MHCDHAYIICIDEYTFQDGFLRQLLALVDINEMLFKICIQCAEYLNTLN